MKWYAIAKGEKTGYWLTEWDTIKSYVIGHPGAIFKGFKTEAEAAAFYHQYNGSQISSQPNNLPTISTSTNTLTMPQTLSQNVPPISPQTLSQNVPQTIPQIMNYTYEYSSISAVNTYGQTAVYTDGSYKDNKGGWAAILVQNGQIVDRIYGRVQEYETTNNRAEILALIFAFLKYGDKYPYYTDSDYSVKTFNIWSHKWELNGWKKYDGNTPENLDLVKYFKNLTAGSHFKLTHVYGHANNIYNEECDRLAKLGTTLPLTIQ